MSLQENVLLTSAHYLNQKKYWQDKLTDLSSTELLELLNEAGDEWCKIGIELSDEVIARVLGIAKGADVSLFVLMLTNLNALLHRYLDSNKISVLVPGSMEEKEGVNQWLPVLNQIDEAETFKTLLLKTRTSFLECLENKDYPVRKLFLQLKEADKIKVDFDEITRVSCAMINIHSTAEAKDNCLNFVFELKDDQIDAHILFRKGSYSQYLVENLAANFTRFLEQNLERVNESLRSNEFISEEEQTRILLNSTGLQEDLNTETDSFLRLFEKMVEENPQAIAIITENKEISYLELHNDSNKLANFLLEKGVDNTSTIGVLTDDPIFRMTSILGVLKSGAHFLPIETSLPQNRIVQMLDECAVKLILSTVPSVKSYSYTKLMGLYEKELKKVKTAPRPQLDFDALPHPDRSLVNYETYHSYIGEALAQHTMTIQSTRGCPYLCTFCHKIFPKTHVHRTAKNLFEEVRRLYDIGVRRFEFVDDIFNLVQDNAAEFMELILKHDLKVQLYFTNGLKGDLLSEDFIDLMVAAGTVDFDFSLETGSPRLQKVIKKYLRVDKLKEKINYIIDKHPHVIVEMQTLLGIPTETEEEAMMTLDFIKDLKWIDFPYVHILKIFPGTDMAKVAMENGVSEQAILESSDLAYHELSDTLPFSREFVQMYRAKYFNEYFMNKERFKVVLPKQMKILTENEIIQKYNSFFPQDIRSFDDLLNLIGLTMGDLGNPSFLSKDFMEVKGIDHKLKQIFVQPKLEKDPLNVLLLDLTQYYSGEVNMLYDVVNEPLGLMYILTNLKEEFKGKINGKIAKSRLDFNSDNELKNLINTFKPDVIGIRGMDFYKEFFHRTVALIRQWGIEIPLIAGGPYSSDSYHLLLNDKNIDVAVLGEGEETFNELIAELIKNNKKLPGENVLSTIKGIAYVSQDEKLINNGEGCQVILLDQMENALQSISDSTPSVQRNPSDLAYIMYTSGSTGQPKAVQITENNLNNYIVAFNQEFNLNNTDVVLHQASTAFDTSIEETFPVLTRGGAFAALDRKKLVDINGVLSFIHDKNVSVLDFSPLYIDQLNQFYSPDKFEHVRLIISGGDTLKSSYISNFKEKMVYNTYGPTETTVCATYFKVNDFGIESNYVPIGKPIKNYTVYVLDNTRKLVPEGRIGEIYVSGKGVSSGYKGNEELTSNRFVANPFRPGELMYRTGDLGRWDETGNIIFHGRNDRQISLRGFRIELGEIEATLSQKHGVQNAVVKLVTINDADVIVAYYVAAIDMEGIQLREFLLKHLPEFMIPSHFIQIERVPLTKNGKVDYGMLPNPEKSDDMVITISLDEIDEVRQNPHLMLDTVKHDFDEIEWEDELF